MAEQWSVTATLPDHLVPLRRLIRLNLAIHPLLYMVPLLNIVCMGYAWTNRHRSPEAVAAGAAEACQVNQLDMGRPIRPGITEAESSWPKHGFKKNRVLKTSASIFKSALVPDVAPHVALNLHTAKVLKIS
ncbi:hypothetical protein BKA70DRAFT_1242631 [Coprinopsis sp. MPI-PUGE-AT-0042]|nr:hypothetical protein BKA70DRAFT_1242631 [Coprinopsis sp. MPI-PUGE-AT-0042]